MKGPMMYQTVVAAKRFRFKDHGVKKKQILVVTRDEAALLIAAGVAVSSGAWAIPRVDCWDQTPRRIPCRFIMTLPPRTEQG